MQLLKEIKLSSFPVNKATPKVKCKVFEDNSGALEWQQAIGTDLEQNISM